MLDDVNVWVGSADGLLRDLLSILKGFRNGFVYGAKIRLPHAVVMTFLFRPEPYSFVTMIVELVVGYGKNCA
jgi:peroxisomal membrane protein 4